MKRLIEEKNSFLRLSPIDLSLVVYMESVLLDVEIVPGKYHNASTSLVIEEITRPKCITIVPLAGRYVCLVTSLKRDSVTKDNGVVIHMNVYMSSVY